MRPKEKKVACSTDIPKSPLIWISDLKMYRRKPENMPIPVTISYFKKFPKSSFLLTTLLLVMSLIPRAFSVSKKVELASEWKAHDSKVPSISVPSQRVCLRIITSFHT